MMKNLGDITQSLNVLRRFHMVIFIVVVMVSLTAAVFLLNRIVLKTSTPPSSFMNGTKTSFDQSTINRIKQLKTTDDPSTPLDFSQGRISPFSE